MPRNDDRSNRPQRSGDEEPLDFGTFVSQNVQRTSDLLKGDGSTSQATTSQDRTAASSGRPDGNRTVERARDGSYWRRKAANVDSEEVPPPAPTRSGRNRYLPPNDEEISQFHDENEFGDHGGGVGGFFSGLLSGDGDDGNRNRIIAAIVAIVVLVLIVWGLIQVFGDDGDSGDGGDSTPTPTVLVDQQSTPGVETQTTPTPPATEEPEIPRGGDNQRGDGGDTQEDSPTQIAVADLTSDVARACTGHCLVRIEGPDQQKALDEADARVSWADGDISWIVVTPTQAEVLDRTQELTLIETEPRTYNLYMVKAPEDHNQADVISPHGEIIDSTGRYYLVRWSSVPAVVKPVTDWGYAVFKIAPSPPSFIDEAGRSGPAKDTNGWDLQQQVDQGNVERVINDLAHVGELDNSGWGTRYYTYPGNQIAADYLYQELESYGLDVWYEDFIMWDGYLLVNVVAEIPGSDDSEVYALMAHFDSINLDNPRIAPGADDNASGIAVTLETARILSAYKLEHPVRIAFVNAEEVGIIGSSAWAREANNKNLPVQGVFNIDSVGSIRNRPYLITNATGSSVWMQQTLNQVNEDYSLGETLQQHQTTNIVADDNFVRAEGIDAVMIARELYKENDYHHTIDDNPDNVSMGAVSDTTYIILIAIWQLAG